MGEQITIRDIAKKCGVGVSTVSRAINNHPDINEETRQLILDTIEKYGYVPHTSARIPDDRGAGQGNQQPLFCRYDPDH